MRSAAGRVLGFALMAVLLMSVIGLAASQTFINKTGKTVTGIKIEFSKSVRITGHDSAFPDQSPAGRGDQFTFSGGELRNFGRFSITWLPSSGRVTGYEWIKKTQPVQETQATSSTPSSSKEEFKLPNPNTPPILYGNDYPGPDEPKYQPQPDEQIWLTDLDCHGDIYDNDSIKINYAPGFDVSKITKIDVYRNRIKLRFVPEKFDVLTNAQMKTFDGNPAEHSPASNHTDHAIMGYEYKFDIHTADDLWILKKTVKSGFRWRPKEIWAQMDNNWTDSFSELNYSDLINFFQILKQDGFTGIAFEMGYYMNSPYENNLFELKNRDPNIAAWGVRTPTLGELETMLKAINEVGLNSNVRGQIYISLKYQNEQHDSVWSSFIDPRNPKEFFDNYTNLWVKLIPVLNKYHVKLLTPFIEMEGIEKYSDLIKNMYTKISGSYNGEMGFEEATHSILEGVSPMQHGRTFMQMVRKFTFWDWKDSQRRPMVIEYSCWVPPLSNTEDQAVTPMLRNFVKFWKPAVDYYNLTYPNNPQMFGELGVFGADGICLGQPYWDISNKRFDDQEMADIWYTYLKGSKELGINRIDIWNIGLGDLWVNTFPGGSFLNIGLRQPESPAYKVIKTIIAPEE